MDYYTFITAAVQNRWNLWNVRGFMILSLCMQLILTIVTPFRQKTSNRFAIFLIWSSYLLAYWGPSFIFGLISNAGCWRLENKDAQVPQDVMAFWAAFLLVHLGGPDTITAFSLEDNALWLRHLIGLVAQVSVFLYIFVKTLPNNRLLVPTMLIFVAGVINYGERTRALYLASLENLKRTIIKPKHGSDLPIPRGIFMGLLIDIVPHHEDCHEIQEIMSFEHNDVLLIIISLARNVLYELFYTKIKAANSTWGKIARACTNYSILVAFTVFCLADKHQFREVDLAITFALFVGAFILQVANAMMLLTSDFQERNTKEIILLGLARGIFPLLVVFAFVIALVTFLQGSAIDRLFKRLWSEKMGSFDVLLHCFRHCTPRKCQKLGFIWNVLLGERHASWEHFDISLWESVSEDIKGKASGAYDAARMRSLYEARGDRALEKNGCSELMPYISGFQYGNTLLIWHVATEICINIEREKDDVGNAHDRNWKRKFSKKLSDYMMYLLVMQPKLMSAVAGISHIRYEDTCVELKLLGRNFGAPTMREFCESILKKHTNIVEHAIEENNHSVIIEPTTEENNNHMHSVLMDSCSLVWLLREKDNRWDVIFEVWVELLSYAAGHCRAESHFRLLSEGSEFITIIWILMGLLGIRDQAPLK